MSLHLDELDRYGITRAEASAEAATPMRPLPSIPGCEHTDTAVCEKCGWLLRWGTGEVTW